MASSLNTITVDGVTYNADAYADKQKKDTLKNEMDKDAFLQLLVTQLRYQDPLEPQDNSEFVAEMAQFSSLEQMNNVASSLEKINTLVTNIDTSVLVGQLSNMIGKGVDWIETINTADEEGNPVTNKENFSGVITGVTVADGTTRITVEDAEGKTHQVDVANIGHVYELKADGTAATSDSATDETSSTETSLTV